MRLRELFLASLLTVTFGCPGDDSGDTDANTTETPATTDATGTTTGTPGTTTDATGSTSDSPTGTSDSPTSTTDTPADSSTGADSGSGTAGAATCEDYCAAFIATCGGGSFDDFGDEATCLDACAGYDAATLDCKAYHVSVADGPESEHCGHSNLDGGGVC